MKAVELGFLVLVEANLGCHLGLGLEGGFLYL